MKSIVLLFFFLCPVISGYGQKQYFSIAGKTLGKEYIVPEQATTYFLPGTYIQVKEMPEKRWLSDAAGYFKIDSLPSGKYHFEFSYIGFESIDTAIAVNRDIQNLQITLSDFGVSTLQLYLILPEAEECRVIQNSFWDKYGLRAAWYTKESLRNKVQRISLSGYCADLIRNRLVFDYLDKKYGYNWRFEAPEGIIGLDETLDSCKLFVK